MPKSRLLSSNSNNHFDDKELLIPNNQQHDNCKSIEPKTTFQQKQSPSSGNLPSSIDGHLKNANHTTTTAVNRTNSRSIAKRPVSSTASSAANVKPNTILSLEDRDIVIIDNVDYKESTSSAANVIVVEKPCKLNHHKPTSDIDLAELLESNWPASAGDLALALNGRSTNGVTQHNFSGGSTSTSNSSISCHPAACNSYSIERNRSRNPLSHIGQPKIKRNIGNNINNFNTTGNLINLDSDGSSASGSFESNSSK